MVARVVTYWFVQWRLRRWEKSKQAKSVCMSSSRLMSSFEKVSPGMRPRSLSQKIDANEPEKKMPSTTANATRRSANVASRSEIVVGTSQEYYGVCVKARNVRTC